MSFLDVLRYFRREWSALAAITGLSIIGASLDASSVVFVVGLADAVSKGVDAFDKKVGPFSVHASVTTLTVLAVVTIVGSVLMTLTANRLRAGVTSGYARRRRRELLASFLAAPWAVQSKDRSGHLQAHLGYITASSSLITHVSGAFRGLSGVLILVGAALLISPVAALGIIVLGLILFFVLRPLNKLVKRRSRETTKLNKKVSVDFGELSELAREIRVFGVTPRFQERLEGPIDDLSASERRVGVLSGTVTPLYQGMALSVIVGALAVASGVGSVDVALLGAVALLVLRSVSYGQQFQTSFNGLHGATPSLEVLDTTLAQLQAAEEPHGRTELAAVEDVRIEGVTFSYGGDDAALRAIDLSFRRGEIVGVVGPSGAGKTTLAQVLLRLRTPDAGRLVVNGLDATEYSDESWARSVALVPQEPYLMHGTLIDNIGFLRDLPVEAIVEAAKATGIHDTILTLDDGYDTPIGKSMRNLSGGQIQRIGIARALAGTPTMIVLDEPTSALDQHSEAIVQATLEQLRGHALVVVIAHRLTTLSICDRVIVMEGGQVDADGALSTVINESAFFKSAIDQLSLASNGTIPDPPPG